MNDSAGETFIRQAFDLWITPEVEKRQAAGQIETPFELAAAQVLFPPDGGGFTVRLNGEVRGIGYARTDRQAQIGERILQSDWNGLESFDVADEDLNSGHVTILLVRGGWFCTFNFLRRRAYCGSLLEKARQFLEVAQSAQIKSLNAPAVDNLFSAAELASKVYLILHSAIKLDTRTHGPIHSAINQARRLNNVNSAFVDLFNKLSQLRQSARYNAGALEDLYLTADDFELVETVIADYATRCVVATPKNDLRSEAIMREIMTDVNLEDPNG